MKIAIYILIFLPLLEAKASLEQTYGLGGTTSGRVSGITADSETPYAAIFNPSLLGTKKEAQFAFSLGFQNSSFDKGSTVLVDSPAYRTIDGVQRTAEFDLPRLSETLWSLGACFPFTSKALHRNMGLGVALSGPTGKLRTFSAQTPYDFSVLRPGTSDSQFKGTVALGSEILPEFLYFGAGLSLFITAAGAADAFLLDNNPTGRLNLEVGFNTAATLGLFAKLPSEKKEPHQLSFVFHQAIHPSFEEHFTGKVQVAEGAGTAAIPAILRTSLYYEPHTFEGEWQKRFSDVTVSIGLSYQLWKNYEPSYLTLESPTSRGEVQKTLTPPLALRNTLNPRISGEWAMTKTWKWSLGYLYRPTPIEDLSGPLNLLDSNTHIIGTSFGTTMAESDWIPFPFSVQLYAQYHIITSREVVKSDPSFIGAPGYRFGGNSFLIGASLQSAW